MIYPHIVLPIRLQGTIVSRCLRLSDRSKMTSVVEHSKARWRHTSFTKPIWRLTRYGNKQRTTFVFSGKNVNILYHPCLKIVCLKEKRPLKMRFVFTFPPHCKCDSLMRPVLKEHKQFLSTQRVIYSSLFIMHWQSFPQNSSCFMR